MKTANHLVCAFLRRCIVQMKRLGLTQTELAKRMKISRPYVTKLLSGDVNITFASAERLAKALKMDFFPALKESHENGITRVSMSKNDFSENLFWDADPSDLDFDRNRRYVIQRVLERGTVKDLGKIFNLYGMAGVVETAKTLRVLEPRALSFVACIANEPKENFRCYTQKQSSRAPWIY